MNLITPIQCASLPKIVLHDHLDGGLRPTTVHRILTERNLPTPWGSKLATTWFSEQANKKSLPAYLECFKYTLQCMQRKDDITTIAYEAALDLHNDNVQYAELRFCPLLSTTEGLRSDEVVEAALLGLHNASTHTSTKVNLILCAMRQNDPQETQQIVNLAKRYAHLGVVAVDLAGPEHGFLPTPHRKAFEDARNSGLNITIHAGEVCGLDSIKAAIDDGFAQRIGHGIRVLDGVQSNGELDPILWDILERNIVLEVCPSSNVQTGAVDTLTEHPWAILDRLGFPITLNTDNRLMGNTTTTQEWQLAAKTFDFTIEDAMRYTQTAINGAFTTDSHKKTMLLQLKTWAELENKVDSNMDFSI